MKYKYTNHLINEHSPYLLQHAHNPVNWYPWGNEAFKKAVDENKPIFLSIGYSTCHWCHVMEKESFEDLDVAKLLNDNFIAIKVDREQRPDVDAIYMDACQEFTGSGGWPLTLFLDNYQRPFFAGTYYPKNSTSRQIGLIDLLEKISNGWRNNKAKLIHSSDGITDAIKKLSHINDSIAIDNDIHDKLFKQLIDMFDTKYGGFGNDVKFPMPVTLYYLLRYYYANKDDKALFMLTYTLENMYKGGIYDHIGYGFSRYSTDTKWLVPHFEKMLYDNALLSLIYTETYQLTKNMLYSNIANEIFTYLIRDMMAPNGGFYSAEDADSEGIEGKFYLWKYDEIIDLLGKDKGIKFCKQFHITQKGNFAGKNIPHLINSEFLNMDKDTRDKLYAYRNKRVHPHKDDKILTAWNSIMIASLSVAGKVFHNDKYIEIAKKTVDFIYSNLIDTSGRLLTTYKDNHASVLAFATDYAFLIWGLIELYEATFETTYLEKAINLSDDLIKHFWDEELGGLYFYGNDAEKLILRPKDIYDNVLPSANSVAALNWFRLFNITSDPKFEDYANKQLHTFSSSINNNPYSTTFMLTAHLFAISRTKELIITGEKNSQTTKEMFDILNSTFNPFLTSVFKDKKQDDKLLKLLPHLSNYSEVSNVTTAYVCSNHVCSMPITSINEIKDIL